ncbi:hypothetical protein [Teredinibacter purpureus]|uniref:hypothetical protein n=1 Tax=Teredinibacter purpureus TaxID=2731756 RepID=UPI0005F7ABF5|nr:hypothetical protein [Teredinibacter purpureus]
MLNVYKDAPSLPRSPLFKPRSLTHYLGLRLINNFWGGQLSEIGFDTRDDGSERLTGNPKLLGMHVGFAPLEGFAIGFNRMLQYGGADRDESISSLAQAFFNVKIKRKFGDRKN